MVATHSAPIAAAGTLVRTPGVPRSLSPQHAAEVNTRVTGARKLSARRDMQTLQRTGKNEQWRHESNANDLTDAPTRVKVAYALGTTGIGKPDMQISGIRDGVVVEVDYTLRDDAGKVLDASEPGDPLAYLQGAENIVPGLERALSGKVVGDSFTVRVEPIDGYGERIAVEAKKIPRKAFPARMKLATEMQFELEDEEGETIAVYITAIHADHVLCDPNHPLAGVYLNFEVKVLSIREATAEEVEHGHPHGPHGHHHH